MKLHVEHNVTPRHIEAILPLFNSYPILDKDLIYNELNYSGHKINLNYLSKNLGVLYAFGLIDVNNKNYIITPSGKKMFYTLQYDKKKFYDIFHFLYYTSDFLMPNKNTNFCWTYKSICDYLWDNVPKNIDDKYIINKILILAQNIHQENNISLSHWAMSGVRNWLNALNPPFIVSSNSNKSINRRLSCTPELFLLAIDYYYKINKNMYGTPILLNDTNKEIISKLCLIDQNVFMNMLELTKSIYPIITSNSVWGVSISINHPTQMIDIL